MLLNKPFLFSLKRKGSQVRETAEVQSHLCCVPWVLIYFILSTGGVESFTVFLTHNNQDYRNISTEVYPSVIAFLTLSCETYTTNNNII